MHDWHLEQEQDRINEMNKSYYADLAAKLVILGWDRPSAVQAIKNVNDNRHAYYGNTNVHIMGEDGEPDIWLLTECNYPPEVNGNFNPFQVTAIAQELADSFD